MDFGRFYRGILILLKVIKEGPVQVHLPKLLPELGNGLDHMPPHNKQGIFSGRDMPDHHFSGLHLIFSIFCDLTANHNRIIAHVIAGIICINAKGFIILSVRDIRINIRAVKVLP